MSAPWPVRRAADQRFEDRGMRGGAGGDVDDRHADARGAFRPAGDRGEAALGLDQQIIGLAMRVGAVVAIAGDGADDQRRIVLAQPLAGEAELVHRAGLEVLQQHVGGGDQLLQLGAAFLGGEIDHRGFLAAVEPDEVAALALRRGVIAAGEIALRPFDLDDMRAGIGQPRTANGAATACSTATTVNPSSGSIDQSLPMMPSLRAEPTQRAKPESEAPVRACSSGFASAALARNDG